MARVTRSDVQLLFRDSTPDVSDEQLDGAITTATLLVDTRVAPAIIPATLEHLSVSTLKEVERYLAAHFVALIDLPRSSESVTTLTDRFQQKVDLGLLFTMYGQQAVMLDATNTLRNMTAVKGQAPSTVGGAASFTLLDEGLLG